MLTEPTLEKLKSLHLYVMANAWVGQRTDPAIAELDFDGRFALLVDAEHIARDNKRIGRLLREAKLRIPSACLEDIDYAPKRELDRAQIRQLSSGRWIADHANVLITGMTGVGKSVTEQAV
ncbi:ATP-binding protein [Sorangium sp. So ce1504]|uniref:ATP-binding protein n=1 Tax=Sorangium sp. So ce1504 TaxID=3133337 RepID=UPI003F5EDE39